MLQTTNQYGFCMFNFYLSSYNYLPTKLQNLVIFEVNVDRYVPAAWGIWVKQTSIDDLRFWMLKGIAQRGLYLEVTVRFSG